MPEQTFLDIRHLDAGYGRSQVLFDVNIGIPWRGGVAVLGRNGAGKTTLMKTIVGELASSQGELSFDGRDITRRRTEERVRSGIGYVPQEHSVFARLSVRDNLAVGSLSNSDASAVDRVLAIFPKLGQRLDQPAGTLSGGERKMLAIGRAMLGNPKLLLLDEPTEGVWIGVIEEITEYILTYDDRPSYVVSIMEFRDGLVVHETQYFADRFDPSPSRAHLVKHVDGTSSH